MAVHQRRIGSPLRPESHGPLTTDRDPWLHTDADQYERAYDSYMVVRLVAWVQQPSTGARGGAPRQSFYMEVDAETYEDAERHVRAQLDPGWLLRAWRVERNPGDLGPAAFPASPVASDRHLPGSSPQFAAVYETRPGQKIRHPVEHTHSPGHGERVGEELLRTHASADHNAHDARGKLKQGAAV